MLSRLSNRKSTSLRVVFTSIDHTGLFISIPSVFLGVASSIMSPATLTFSVHVPASRPYILNLSLFSRLFNHHASPSLSRWQSGLSLLFSYPAIHLFLFPSSLLVHGHRWTPPPPHRPTPTPSPLLLIVPMSRSHSRCSKLMKVFRIVIPETRPRSHPVTRTHTHTHVVRPLPSHPRRHGGRQCFLSVNPLAPTSALPPSHTPTHTDRHNKHSLQTIRNTQKQTDGSDVSHTELQTAPVNTCLRLVLTFLLSLVKQAALT